MLRWAGHLENTGGRIDAYKIFDGKSAGNRSFRRRMWENTIQTDLKEIGFEEVEWIYLAWGSVQ
jgi:hypothetical protein